jgi:protease-4
MPTSLSSKFGRALRAGWWVLDTGRRALLNLLLLVLLIALVWGLIKGGPKPLDTRTTLVIDLSGRISEQSAGSVRSGALQQLRGGDPESIRLRDVLATLAAAAKDPQVTQALLLVDDLSAAGQPTLHEVASAIDRFKAAGKPVYAWGASYDQRQYYLAAHATQIWLDPMGELGLEGYGGWRTYYKDLLDRLGLSANVMRVGKFKNFGEVYSASGPSKETLESDGALYNGLWNRWLAAVEPARKLPGGSIMAAIDTLPDSLQASGGDAAKWAVAHKWVDALKTRDEMRAALSKTGAADTENKTFRQVALGDYAGRLKPRNDGDAVGVIVAEGEIGDGNAPLGAIGGQSTAALIRKAREDDNVKALVLRVNSPGGSAYGAELVRRELALTRQAGKPVVVSMGDVAASGGYWISTAADDVFADPATITGSIGVIALLPSGQVALDKLGVHTGGVTTTWMTGAYDPRRGITPRYAQLIQTSLDHTYFDFTSLVAAARKTTREQVDAVGQGRVWSGQDALARGLVDRLGSYQDALTEAARLGKVAEGYRVQYFEVEPGRLEQLLRRFDLSALPLSLGRPASDWQADLAALGLSVPVTAQMAQDLAWLAGLAARHAPYTTVAHCLCEVP